MRKRSKALLLLRRRAIALTLAATSFGLGIDKNLQAADFYWDADGAGPGSGGTGNWDVSSSLWRAGSANGTLGPWTNGGNNNDAILQGTSGTLTLSTGISANDITVAPSPSGIYTIAGASQSLTLNGATKPIINVASGSSLVVSSQLAGSYGFTKANSGSLILDTPQGTGSVLGSVSVTGGNLQVGVASASATYNTAAQALRSNAVDLGAGTSLTTGATTVAGGSSALSIGTLTGSGSVTPGITNGTAVGGAINILALSSGNSSATITTGGGLNLRGGNGTTQTLSGNATGLTGTIAVSTGATLSLTGTGNTTSGVLGLSTGTTTSIALQGGNFTLDNTNGNTSAGTGRLSDDAGFSFQGGTLSLIGDVGGTTETIGATTFNSGSNTISVTNRGGTGTGLSIRDGGSLRDQNRFTVNFVGIGGALGSPGAGPSISYTTSRLEMNTMNGMLADSSSSTVQSTGWAVVNGTSWAGVNINNNSIVALADTNRNSSTLNSAVSQELVGFAPSATTTTLTANLGSSDTNGIGALKISPTAAGQTLDVGTNSIFSSALMLTGTTDFSITGTTGGLQIGAGTRYVWVTDAGTTLNYGASFASTGILNKSGAGILNLNGASSQLPVGTSTNILEGVLRGTTTTLGGSTSAGAASTTVNFRGGVLEISGGGSLTRGLLAAGTASGGAFNWDNGSLDRGDGGFSAIGGNATVTLVTAAGGAVAATPTWNDGLFAANGNALIMGSTKADSRIDFTNAIGLDNGAAANSYFAREIRVADNASSSTDVARLSGVISGSANADLLKTGAGVLELTGANTFAGNTIIQQGTLIATNGSALSNSGAVILANTAGANLQLNNNETIGALSGGGTTGGNVVLGANALTVGDQRDSTFGGVVSGTGGSLVKQGAGTLLLTTNNTYTGSTTVNAGTLQVTNTGSLASTSGLTVGSAGAAIFANAGQTLGAVTNGNTASNSINFTATSGTVTLASLAGSGSTRFGSNAVITGGISTGTVTAVGSLTSAVSGGAVNANTLVGPISGGTVTINGLVTGDVTGAGNLGAGSLNSTLVSGGTNNIIGAASITTLSGGTNTVGGVATVGTMSSGTANLNGATSSITTLNGGSVNLGSSTVLTVDSGTTTGSITGAGASLIKNGTGTLTLSGTNTYTGATTVSAGTLTVNGSLAGASAVTVANGATLNGSGSVGGIVSVNGTLMGTGSYGATTINSGGILAPGNSPGNETFTSLSLADGSIFNWELAANSTANPGVSFDTVTVSGPLTVGAISSNLNFAGVDWGNSFWTSDQTWNVFKNATSLSFGSILINSIAGGTGVAPSAGSFRWVSSGTNLNLQFTATAVPEPSSIVLATLGAAGIVTKIRRRKRQNSSTAK